MPVPADLAAWVTDADVARGQLRTAVDLATMLLELVVDAALLLAISLGPLGRRLWATCLRLGARLTTPMLDRALGDTWKASVLAGVGLVVAREVVGFPIAFGRDFLFYRHLGVSTESLSRFVGLFLFGVVTSACAFAALCAVLGAIRTRFARWWLVVGVPASAVLLVSAVVEPLWLRVSFEVESLPTGALRSRLESQLAAHREPIEDIVAVDASKYGTAVNAMIAGFGPTRRIILTDTLVALGDDAVAGAVMHEIGHRRGERLPLRLAIACGGLIALLFAIEQLLRHFRARGSPSDVNALAGVLVVLSVAWLALAPIRAAFQRAEEDEADGVELAARSDYDAYIDAQVVLMRANALDPDPAAWGRLLASHPSPADRMRRALWYKRERAEAR